MENVFIVLGREGFLYVRPYLKSGIWAQNWRRWRSKLCPSCEKSLDGRQRHHRTAGGLVEASSDSGVRHRLCRPLKELPLLMWTQGGFWAEEWHHLTFTLKGSLWLFCKELIIAGERDDNRRSVRTLFLEKSGRGRHNKHGSDSEYILKMEPVRLEGKLLWGVAEKGESRMAPSFGLSNKWTDVSAVYWVGGDCCKDTWRRGELGVQMEICWIWGTY